MSDSTRQAPKRTPGFTRWYWLRGWDMWRFKIYHRHSSRFDFLVEMGAKL